MNSCSCCGSSIPEGQNVCSMCYGDMNYGSDGYYEQWAREQEIERVPASKSSDDLPF